MTHDLRSVSLPLLFVATRLHCCQSLFAIYVTVSVCDKDGLVCGISHECRIPNQVTLTCLASQCENETVKQDNIF